MNTKEKNKYLRTLHPTASRSYRRRELKVFDKYIATYGLEVAKERFEGEIGLVNATHEAINGDDVITQVEILRKFIDAFGSAGLALYQSSVKIGGDASKEAVLVLQRQINEELETYPGFVEAKFAYAKEQDPNKKDGWKTKMNAYVVMAKEAIKKRSKK